MSVRAIEKIGLTNAKVQLLSLVGAGKLKRRKTGGEYRYFSADPKIRKRQEEACRNEFSDSERTRCLELAEKIPLEDVLKILVTHIGNPKFSPKGVALSLIRRGEDAIVPLLEKVKFLFGIASAVVSDMSESIKNAVAKVFRGVPHRLCHFQ
jgi:hypothetical protein